jgi:RepB DNA-primase from phage plasmid
MLNDFLSHLHRGGAYAYYHILPERRSLWYATRSAPSLAPATANTNLYFGVHPTSVIPPANAHGEVRPPQWVRGQLWCIAAINCLFAEYDEKDYGSLTAILLHLDSLVTPAPSVLVHSGGGVHAYWLLAEPYLLTTDERRQAARSIQDRWVDVVGGDGGAKDLCRVLRVPGSWNYKYEPRRPVEWLGFDLACTYPLSALTIHLPPVIERQVEPVRWQQGGDITEYNAGIDIGTLLERHGYRWQGRHKMLSPYSSTGQAGVTVDANSNRAYVHHGSDPLHDGYWKRPFDVVCILDYAGDFKRTLAALKNGQL